MSRRPLLFCRDAILLAACRAAPAFNSLCRRSQTLRRDAALVSRPKERATRPRVLLWGIRVDFGMSGICPVTGGGLNRVKADEGRALLDVRHRGKRARKWPLTDLLRN